MTSKSIRSFAFGLMIAAGLFAAVYFFGPSETTNSQTVDTPSPSEDEMKNTLTAKGYVIQTEEEWNEHQVALEEAKKITPEEAPTETETVQYRAMISVSLGMTSTHVGQALEEMKIITNDLDFSNEVEKRGLANELRPGIYEVQSGMTIDDIIASIFQ